MKTSRVTVVLFVAFILGLSSAWAGESSLIPGWKLGPDLQIGFPHPVNVSLDARSIVHDFSLAVGGGYFGLTFPVDQTKVTASVRNIDARVRWHPFSGAFFLGAAFGKQWLSGAATEPVDVHGTSVPTRVDVQLNNFYVTPHAGWLWSFGSGFVLGFEFGVQSGFSLSSNVNVSLTDPAQNSLLDLVKQTQQYRDLQAKTEDGINRLGKIQIPYVSLLRIGWFF